MILFHWTLNIKNIKAAGFRDCHRRHPDEIEGVWFADTLMGGPDSIRPGMRLVTVDMPVIEVEPYEEVNGGSGYRAFSIPADILNKFVLNFPSAYSDRGAYKINS